MLFATSTVRLRQALCFGAFSLFVIPLQAQFPLELPEISTSRLNLVGNHADGFGITGYRNAVTGQPNSGHVVTGVIQNAPDTAPPPHPPVALDYYADYYISGRSSAPFYDAGSPAAAAATSATGMTHLTTYLTVNTLSFNSVRFDFGAVGGAANLQNSWNLGADSFGNEWTGNMASPIENRIYAANSGQVETYLLFNAERIVNFGYSNLYEIINYGPTSGPGDDSIQAYSDAVSATIVPGLAGEALGVAEAFLADVAAGGGSVQLYFDTFQAAAYTDTPQFYVDTNYLAANYDFSGSIMIVPEPSAWGVWVGVFGAMAALGRRRIR